MTDKITLEDYNIWQYLFTNKITTIEIPADLEVGEYDLFDVISYDESNNRFLIRLKVKPFVYSPTLDFYVYYTKFENNTLTTYASKLDTELFLDDYIYQFYYTQKSVPCYLLLATRNLYLVSSYPGGIYPYASTYYLFNGDDGSNRKFRLKTQYNSQKVNNKEDIEVVDAEHKYCSLKLVLTDRKLCNNRGYGVGLSNLTKSIYEPPLPVVKEPVYYGCNNNLIEKLELPVDFECFVNNRQYDNYYVPVDYDNDKLQVNVRSKSSYPYLPLNRNVFIPIEYKIANSIRELSGYEYVKVARDFAGGFSILFDNDLTNVIDLDEHTLTDGFIRNDKETSFINGEINYVRIVNEGVLSLKNVELNSEVNPIINNGTLTIEECLINKLNIINNGVLNIINSNLDLLQTNRDLPFIHNTGEYNVINNNINFNSNFNNNSIIFIRTNELKEELLQNNDWDYNVTYTEDETNYNILGNGFIYSNLDDDSLILKNLEVSEDV